MEEINRSTTRRALLAAAAGGAAALAVRVAAPLPASADTGGNVILGTANTADAVTGIAVTGDVDAFSASAPGASGSAIHATTNTEAAIYATNGDPSGAVARNVAKATGMYGFAPTQTDPNLVGTGVWGDSGDLGVYGSGAVGVEGDTFAEHGIGVLGWGQALATVGVEGIAGGPSTIGVHAVSPNGAIDRTALRVTGKAIFSRSGRTAISAGHSSKVVSLAGVTGGSLIFAVLASNRAGRWIRAVVPATGKFTIVLNTTVSRSTAVAWFVLN
jgi:hypothetical protein